MSASSYCCAGMNTNLSRKVFENPLAVSRIDNMEVVAPRSFIEKNVAARSKRGTA